MFNFFWKDKKKSQDQESGAKSQDSQEKNQRKAKPLEILFDATEDSAFQLFYENIIEVEDKTSRILTAIEKCKDKYEFKKGHYCIFYFALNSLELAEDIKAKLLSTLATNIAKYDKSICKYIDDSTLILDQYKSYKFTSYKEVLNFIANEYWLNFDKPNYSPLWQSMLELFDIKVTEINKTKNSYHRKVLKFIHQLQSIDKISLIVKLERFIYTDNLNLISYLLFQRLLTDSEDYANLADISSCILLAKYFFQLKEAFADEQILDDFYEFFDKDKNKKIIFENLSNCYAVQLFDGDIKTFLDNFLYVNYLPFSNELDEEISLAENTQDERFKQIARDLEGGLKLNGNSYMQENSMYLSTESIKKILSNELGNNYMHLVNHYRQDHLSIVNAKIMAIFGGKLIFFKERVVKNIYENDKTIFISIKYKNPSVKKHSTFVEHRYKFNLASCIEVTLRVDEHSICLCNYKASNQSVLLLLQTKKILKQDDFIYKLCNIDEALNVACNLLNLFSQGYLKNDTIKTIIKYFDKMKKELYTNYKHDCDGMQELLKSLKSILIKYFSEVEEVAFKQVLAQVYMCVLEVLDDYSKLEQKITDSYQNMNKDNRDDYIFCNLFSLRMLLTNLNNDLSRVLTNNTTYEKLLQNSSYVYSIGLIFQELPFELDLSDISTVAFNCEEAKAFKEIFSNELFLAVDEINNIKGMCDKNKNLLREIIMLAKVCQRSVIEIIKADFSTISTSTNYSLRCF